MLVSLKFDSALSKPLYQPKFQMDIKWILIRLINYVFILYSRFNVSKSFISDSALSYQRLISAIIKYIKTTLLIGLKQVLCNFSHQINHVTC